MKKSLYLVLMPFVILCIMAVQKSGIPHPVNPNANAEACKLLKFIYHLKAKKLTLAGQHNYVQFPGQYVTEAYEHTGKRPALWGSDFSYGQGLNGPNGFRQKMVEEAIRQWNAGAIVTIMYHQVKPSDPDELAWKSVTSKMSESEFDSLLTDQTSLHKAWKVKMDTIAVYLKKIEAAGVPVLFRPYHEMNGHSFWWGQQKRYADLYRMTWKYLTVEKGLNNLLWVWNSNRISKYTVSMLSYFPGEQYVDILATDVYGNDYNEATYSEMLRLAGTKPIALGEVGIPPTDSIFKLHPNYVWAMEWARPTDKTTWEYIKKFYYTPRVITRETLPQYK